GGAGGERPVGTRDQRRRTKDQRPKTKEKSIPLLSWSLVFRLWSSDLALPQQHHPGADQQQREDILIDIKDIRQHQQADAEPDTAEQALALALPGRRRLELGCRRRHREVGLGRVDPQIDRLARGRPRRIDRQAGLRVEVICLGWRGIRIARWRGGAALRRCRLAVAQHLAHLAAELLADLAGLLAERLRSLAPFFGIVWEELCAAGRRAGFWHHQPEDGVDQ